MRKAQVKPLIQQPQKSQLDQKCEAAIADANNQHQARKNASLAQFPHLEAMNSKMQGKMMAYRPEDVYAPGPSKLIGKKP